MIFHEEDRVKEGNNKIYIINRYKNQVEAVLLSKFNWVPVKDQTDETLLYFVNGTFDTQIKINLYQNKYEPGSFPLHLLLLNDNLPEIFHIQY